jgi:hypothetical protein
MLSVMGLMVGFYIITRMMEIVAARYSQPKLGATGTMAIITIIATVAAMIYFVVGPDLIKAFVGLK